MKAYGIGRYRRFAFFKDAFQQVLLLRIVPSDPQCGYEVLRLYRTPTFQGSKLLPAKRQDTAPRAPMIRSRPVRLRVLPSELDCDYEARPSRDHRAHL